VAADAPLRAQSRSPHANGLSPDRLDKFVSHAIGSAKPELLTEFAEHIDRAGVRGGELHCLRHDGRQHCLKVEGGIDRVADLSKRLQLLHRSR